MRRTAILALGLVLTAPAVAADHGLCVLYAAQSLSASILAMSPDERSATTQETLTWTLSRNYSICLNQDEAPGLVDAFTMDRKPVVVADPPPKPKPVAASAHPGCRNYRTYNAKTHTFIDLRHRRRKC